MAWGKLGLGLGWRTYRGAWSGLGWSVVVAPREQAAGGGAGPWRRLVGGAGRGRSSLGALVWGVESCGSLGLGNVGVEGGGPQ